MPIKHIDNVLTIKLRRFDLVSVRNLVVFIIIFFLENNESAPCSILKNIFKNNLSIKDSMTLNDFLKPRFRKFIDLTETDFIIFWNSSCTKGIKRKAINN